MKNHKSRKRHAYRKPKIAPFAVAANGVLWEGKIRPGMPSMVQIVSVKPLGANDSTQKWNSSTSKPLPFSFKSKETWPEIVLERVNTTTKNKTKKN